jgi:hypothetical protein
VKRRHDRGPLPSRIRRRRRVLWFSAPVAIVALLAAAKMISVAIFGGAAVSDFAARDVANLGDTVSALTPLNVIEPAKVMFSQGDLAALEGDLTEADARFGDVLSRTGASESCPVRINLELVRETRGDVAVENGELVEGGQRYAAALAVIKDAPAGCFEGNDDANPDRRAIRADSAARLAHKISALQAPPPAVAAAPALPPPPPPPGSSMNLGELDPDRLSEDQQLPELRLEPGMGNPLDRLQEALGNSSAAGRSGQ